MADALSRQTYPEQSKDAPDPLDSIPSTSIASITTAEEHNQVTFYSHENNSEPLQQPNVCPIFNVDSIETLQNQCPDFGPMYAYFAEGTIR